MERLIDVRIYLNLALTKSVGWRRRRTSKAKTLYTLLARRFLGLDPKKIRLVNIETRKALPRLKSKGGDRALRSFVVKGGTSLRLLALPAKRKRRRRRVRRVKYLV